MESPCRELSYGGLGIVAALSFFWQLIFVCVYWESNPAVSGLIEGSSRPQSSFGYSVPSTYFVPL